MAVTDVPGVHIEQELGADRTMILNMRPQHPSTHGVLRLVVEVDGETIVRIMPDIGYLHTGIEKTTEAKFYQQVVTLTDRIDYLCPMTNNLCYVLAVEKLLEMEPPARGQWIRRGSARSAISASRPTLSSSSNSGAAFASTSQGACLTVVLGTRCPPHYRSPEPG